MRFNQRLAIIGSLCLIIFISLIVFIRGVIRFAHIFGSHPGISLTQQEIWDKYHSENTERQYIPKKIHQIFHNWKEPGNNELPDDWKQVRQKCIEKNPGWDNKLWTTEESRQFLEKEYPWFLPTYDGYAHPVQRVDALKYFLMYHFGGIYIDMDNGCKQPLDSLLYYPTWITDGGHGTLSNNILGSAPKHPFYKQVVESLIPWSWNYLVPYATVHYGSGQWFIGAMWDRYHEALPAGSPKTLHAQSDTFTNEPLIRVQMDMRPGSAEWVFFDHGRGGTWDAWDHKFFDWFGNRFIPMIVRNTGLVVFGFILVLAATIWCSVYFRKRRKQKGYIPVRDEEIEFGELPPENR